MEIANSRPLSGKQPIDSKEIAYFIEKFDITYYRENSEICKKCMNCQTAFNNSPNVPYKISGCCHIICLFCLERSPNKCPKCQITHDPSKKSKSYYAYSKRGMDYPVEVCGKHSKSLEWYCIKCKSLLCAKCRTPHTNSNCQRNDVKLLAPYNVEVHGQIEEQSKEKFDKYVEFLASKDDVVEKVEAEHDQLNEKNLQTFNLCKIDERRLVDEKLEEAVTTAHQELLEIAGNHIEQLDKKKNELKTRKQELERMLEVLTEITEKDKMILANVQLRARKMHMIRSKDRIEREEEAFKAMTANKQGFKKDIPISFECSVKVMSGKRPEDFKEVIDRSIKFQSNGGFDVTHNLKYEVPK